MFQSKKNTLRNILGCSIIAIAIFVNIKNAYASSSCSWSVENHYCVYYERYNTGLCHAGGETACTGSRPKIKIEENKNIFLDIRL